MQPKIHQESKRCCFRKSQLDVMMHEEQSEITSFLSMCIPCEKPTLSGKKTACSMLCVALLWLQYLHHRNSNPANPLSERGIYSLTFSKGSPACLSLNLFQLFKTLKSINIWDGLLFLILIRARLPFLCYNEASFMSTDTKQVWWVVKQKSDFSDHQPRVVTKWRMISVS